MLVGLRPLNGSTADRQRLVSRHAKSGKRIKAKSVPSQHQRDSEDLPRVYVATLPLVGWEVIESALRDAYPDRLALHSVVGVQQDNAFTVFDFLPHQPKSPLTAAELLIGGSVNGLLRERQLPQKLTRRCWLIGISQHKQAVQAARSFNATYPSDLRLFENDCWTHSEALARYLVGDHIDFHGRSELSNTA